MCAVVVMLGKQPNTNFGDSTHKPTNTTRQQPRWQGCGDVTIQALLERESPLHPDWMCGNIPRPQFFVTGPNLCSAVAGEKARITISVPDDVCIEDYYFRVRLEGPSIVAGVPVMHTPQRQHEHGTQATNVHTRRQQQRRRRRRAPQPGSEGGSGPLFDTVSPPRLRDFAGQPGSEGGQHGDGIGDGTVASPQPGSEGGSGAPADTVPPPQLGDFVGHAGSEGDQHGDGDGAVAFPEGAASNVAPNGVLPTADTPPDSNGTAEQEQQPARVCAHSRDYEYTVYEPGFYHLEVKLTWYKPDVREEAKFVEGHGYKSMSWDYRCFLAAHLPGSPFTGVCPMIIMMCESKFIQSRAFLAHARRTGVCSRICTFPCGSRVYTVASSFR